MYRVAITGIGIISCLGNTIEDVSMSLRHGKSGIIMDEKRIEQGFRSPLTGAIQNFHPEAYLSKKQKKTMTDFTVQTYAAAKNALNMSGLSPENIQNDDTGLIFGCDSSSKTIVEQVDEFRRLGQTKGIGSGLIFQSMTSNITMNLNIIFKTNGACWTIASACSSGAHAVGQSAELIAMGHQKRMICGGAQEINYESMCSFDALGAFSINTQSPQEASRPFDINRDGLVPSGGAAVLILERYDIAQKRKATILGEILSYAFSSDGYHISVPSVKGLKSVMKKAISRASIQKSDVDYVCAHATSTPAGDKAEAISIFETFTPHNPYVSSLKSMTGHELWMSGASAVVYSIIMAHEGFIAPNINFKQADKFSEKINIVKETINSTPKFIMCNAAGFGGTNSCIILRVNQ